MSMIFKIKTGHGDTLTFGSIKPWRSWTSQRCNVLPWMKPQAAGATSIFPCLSIQIPSLRFLRPGIKEPHTLLEDNGISPKQIKEICCDMSPSFISEIGEHFPKAETTFDKYHVMQMANQALDEVRKQEQQKRPMLKKHAISG